MTPDEADRRLVEFLDSHEPEARLELEKAVRRNDGRRSGVPPEERDAIYRRVMDDLDDLDRPEPTADRLAESLDRRWNDPLRALIVVLLFLNAVVWLPLLFF